MMDFTDEEMSRFENMTEKEAEYDINQRLRNQELEFSLPQNIKDQIQSAKDIASETGIPSKREFGSLHKMITQA